MRYKAIIEYDGFSYLGYQKQPNHKETIQEYVEKALRLMTQLDIKTFAASRTDKGVHAKGQVIHFDTHINLDSDAWVEALNLRLPGDIRFKKVIKVKENFHSRLSSKSKIYTYHISKKPLSAFEARYMIYDKHFNFDLIKDKIKVLEGTHDFSAFSPNKEDKPPIKTIYEFSVKEYKNKYVFKIHGDSFLRYQVRSMMGNIIEISKGKKPINHLETLLETKNRKLTAKTAPASGLYLEKIFY